MHRINKINGFTLTEILISLGIFVFIAVALAGFGGDIFFLNNSIQSNLSVQIDARRVLKIIVSELRGASPSSLGAYPITEAGTSSITFFSNVDDDILKERVRYFLQNGILFRGIIKPTGTPLVYNMQEEEINPIIRDVVNASTTPLFEYFDTFYTGTSSPLSQPVSILPIRLVRITILLDHDINREPPPMTITTMGTLRNLKDNL